MTPGYVIGVDEAGRGALAGPLVVAAVAFPTDMPRIKTVYNSIRGPYNLDVGDSKGIKNPAHRTRLAEAIEAACNGFIVIEKSAKEIDERLMFTAFPEAIRLAVARVLEKLVATGYEKDPKQYRVLIDGDPVPIDALPCETRFIPDGDKLDWRISAASILAKVHRDQRMEELASRYPDYNFEGNKGYPVPTHKALLKKYGPSPIHRKTFRPVAEAKGRPPGFEF